MSYFDFEKETKATGFTAILLAILWAALVICLIPLLGFWIGYFMGWVAKLLIGNYLVMAFNLFKVGIVADHLPLIGGLLGWVGTFFSSATSSKKK